MKKKSYKKEFVRSIGYLIFYSIIVIITLIVIVLVLKVTIYLPDEQFTNKFLFLSIMVLAGIIWFFHIQMDVLGDSINKTKKLYKKL